MVKCNLSFCLACTRMMRIQRLFPQFWVMCALQAPSMQYALLSSPLLIFMPRPMTESTSMNLLVDCGEIFILIAKRK